MRLLQIPEDQWEEYFFSSTLGLIGTTQFIEAKNGKYKDFDPRDLYSRARIILQNQIYLLFQWSLIRFCIAHPVAEKLIPAKYFTYTPYNFIPDNDEIKLYINNPIFLWRFSIQNYRFFSNIFGKYRTFHRHSNKLNYSNLSTYNVDHSPLVKYVKSNKELISSFKYKFKFLRIKDIKGINLHKLKKIENRFSYQLKPHEKAECFHSVDFQLHLLDSYTTYEDFIQILITGHTSDDSPGELLEESIYISNLKLENSKRERLITKKIGRKENHSKFEKNDKKLIEKKCKKSNINMISCNQSLLEDLPTTAERYLGHFGNVSDYIRLIHFKHIIQNRKLICPVLSPYCTTSAWNDYILISDPNFSKSLYYACIAEFGSRTRVQSFVRKDHNGENIRIGWVVPCHSKDLLKFLGKYFISIVPEANNFLKIPLLKLVDGEFIFVKDEVQINGYLTSCFKIMDKRATLNYNQLDKKSNTIIPKISTKLNDSKSEHCISTKNEEDNMITRNNNEFLKPTINNRLKLFRPINFVEIDINSNQLELFNDIVHYQSGIIENNNKDISSLIREIFSHEQIFLTDYRLLSMLSILGKEERILFVPYKDEFESIKDIDFCKKVYNTLLHYSSESNISFQNPCLNLNDKNSLLSIYYKKSERTNNKSNTIELEVETNHDHNNCSQDENKNFELNKFQDTIKYSFIEKDHQDFEKKELSNYYNSSSGSM